MKAFTKLTGIAAPLPIVNIDTDMIIPKQFLKTIKRSGLGKNLFDEMRFTPEGKEIPEFVLNREPYRHATVIVAGDNFGCGSSREHAPWALLDFGIRCVIAPSFADIFHNNCFQNGILPVTLPPEQVDQLMEDAKAGREITIDLQAQTVKAGNKEFSFNIDAFRKDCMLKGLDAVGITMQHQDAISTFEEKRKASRGW
ncbi:MAG: 3-isopropylmalate dehydratase small subunit [Alphaproteobacteria bacterium]|nr:3-isopropylmalate dehydratase small subunit [Alphaproteobacteria bacterium]